jgi:hypothetical protein
LCCKSRQNARINQQNLADSGWQNAISSTRVQIGTWGFFIDDNYVCRPRTGAWPISSTRRERRHHQALQGEIKQRNDACRTGLQRMIGCAMAAEMKRSSTRSRPPGCLVKNINCEQYRTYA